MIVTLSTTIEQVAKPDKSLLTILFTITPLMASHCEFPFSADKMLGKKKEEEEEEEKDSKRK